MLTSFTVRGFKSYRESTLDLAPLTVLIGANASGKSNLLEGLRLMSWIARGNKLSTIRYMVQEEDRTIRGTVNDLGYRNGHTFTLSCQTNHATWNQYSITLERQDDGELHILDERLTGSDERVPLFETKTLLDAGMDIGVAYNNFARGGRKPQIYCTDQVAVLEQLHSPARFEAGHKTARRMIPKVARQYQDWLSNIVFLDPEPRSMRAYSFKTERVLSGNGSNLSGVLYNLCRKKKTRQEILEFIKALPEQDIEDIDFIETPRGEVMVELQETFGKRTNSYDATLLSDGTLRVLAAAASVLSAPEGSLVVVEEIDNGVHPSRADVIVNRISAVARQRQLRVLLSSHNPALLDALPDDAVPNVVFCYRDGSTGTSRLRRLQDIADYPELIAQGSVGNLMTRGIIERFVKSRLGPKKRRARARAWLAELEKQAG